MATQTHPPETQDAAARRTKIENSLILGPIAPATEPTVAERMAIYGVQGMSVAVMDGGKVDWSAGYGVKEAGSDDPVTSETMFQAMSIAKTLTALLVLRLVGEGRFDLEDDVNAHLKGWKLRSGGDWTPKVTIRQLLSHTGGVKTYGAPGYPRDAKIPTLDQLLGGESPSTTSAVHVQMLPAMNYRYSGGGYSVLQRLVQDVTGMTFENAMQELVFDPLGMSHSTSAQPLPERFWGMAASGHHSYVPAAVKGGWYVFPEQAASGLWSTADDVALAMIEIQRAAAGEDSAFLKPELAQEMLKHHARNFNTGLGTYLHNDGDPETFYFAHEATHLAWKGVAIGFVQGGRGAVILTNNGFGGLEIYREMLDAIALEYGWKGFTPKANVESGFADLSLAGEYHLGSATFVVRANGSGLELLAPLQDAAIALYRTQSGDYAAAGTEVLLTRIAKDPNALLLRQNKLEWTLTKKPRS